MAPQREWEPVVHSAEDCYKMIFEGLDGSFGHVSPVAIRWDELPSHFIPSDAFFEVFRTFIV
jgi:hypothetical protein